MNEYVINSITTDNNEKEVFKHQRHETLNGIEELIEKLPKKEILFELDLNQIMSFSKLRNNIKDDDRNYDIFWNHVISLLFMTDLYEKYFIETKHDLEDERKLLSRDNVDEYFNREWSLVTRDDVFEAIDELTLKNPRVHIILKYVNNDNVLDEVLTYLDGDIPVKIYSDGEIADEKLRGKKVKIYDRENPGLDINEVLGHSYEKKI